MFLEVLRQVVEDATLVGLPQRAHIRLAQPVEPLEVRACHITSTPGEERMRQGGM
jgi:hypothetical protein